MHDEHRMQLPHASRPACDVSVAAIMLFQVAALFARSMLELALLEHGFARPEAAHLSWLVVPPVLLPLMYPYLVRCREALRRLLRPADLTMRVVLAGIALGLTLRLLRWSTLILLSGLGVVSPDHANPIVGFAIGFDCPPAAFLLQSFVVMAVLVPVVEEVVNRGFLLHALLVRGRLPAVLLSAVLFAAMHTPSSYALTFAAGIVFAVQMLNRRTLWAPMVAHAAYNAAAVLDWECLKVTWNLPPQGPARAMILVAASAVTTAGCFAVLLLVRERTAGGCEPASGPPAPTARSRPAR